MIMSVVVSFFWLRISRTFEVRWYMEAPAPDADACVMKEVGVAGGELGRSLVHGLSREMDSRSCATLCVLRLVDTIESTRSCLDLFFSSFQITAIIILFIRDVKQSKKMSFLYKDSDMTCECQCQCPSIF